MTQEQAKHMGHLDPEQHALMEGDFFTAVIVTEDQANPLLFAMEKRAREGEADREIGIERGTETIFLHQLPETPYHPYQHEVSLIHPNSNVKGVNVPLGRAVRFQYAPGMIIEENTIQGGFVACTSAVQGEVIGLSPIGLRLKGVTYFDSQGVHSFDKEETLSLAIPVAATICLVNPHEGQTEVLYRPLGTQAVLSHR